MEGLCLVVHSNPEDLSLQGDDFLSLPVARYLVAWLAVLSLCVECHMCRRMAGDPPAMLVACVWVSDVQSGCPRLFTDL